MTELGYEVPVVGEKHKASDPRVTTALTEIRTVLNGRLTGGNFASETLTPKKFAKAIPWKFQLSFGEEITAGKRFEQTVTEQNTNVLTELVSEAATNVSLIVGEATIAKASIAGSAGTRQIVAIGPFRVLVGESWAVEVTSGSLLKTSGFSYEKLIA